MANIFANIISMETLIFMVSILILSTFADLKVNNPTLGLGTKAEWKNLTRPLPSPKEKDADENSDPNESKPDSSNIPSSRYSPQRVWIKRPLMSITSKPIANLQTTLSDVPTKITTSARYPTEPNANIMEATTPSANNLFTKVTNKPITGTLEMNTTKPEDADIVSVTQATVSSSSISFGTSDSTNITYIRCTRTCYTGPDIVPVCGTDLNTYANENRIKCAKSCGRDIEVLCYAPCPLCATVSTRSRSETTTMVPDCCPGVDTASTP